MFQYIRNYVWLIRKLCFFFLFRNLNEDSTTKVIFCDDSTFSVSTCRYIGNQKFKIQGTNITTLKFSGYNWYGYFFILNESGSSLEVRNV